MSILSFVLHALKMSILFFCIARSQDEYFIVCITRFQNKFFILILHCFSNHEYFIIWYCFAFQNECFLILHCLSIECFIFWYCYVLVKVAFQIEYFWCLKRFVDVFKRIFFFFSMNETFFIYCSCKLTSIEFTRCREKKWQQFLRFR